MYGVVTRNEEETEWSEFDRAFYEVKDVTGRAVEPIAGAVNMVSCFGDNAVESEEDLLAFDDEGTPATRNQPYFDWTYVCPTHDRYREGLLDIIEEAATVNEDVRLDDVGFPRDEYCHCDRCERRFAESEFEDWSAWRTNVITEFVAEARKRVPGEMYLTLYPDPYPGHLEARSGVAVDDIAEYVDEYVVPIYDMAYSTTYWLEILAKGWQDRLSTPFSIELYAVDVDVDDLSKAVEVADEYAESVLFGYDASNARATIRRMNADAREGQSFGPE
ncbi:hypothetical protein [Haloarcula sp. Atlit-7R]|uniref:hypothetical protein n=1 Tax=Haloarcula sp. Atlit-7R TaxID=2282125 RepID=UPI000EF149EE|nr:hypothetical protein [Haloarcula sp. Atlit-7R]RLM95780.1 hypothetical protein D3D01_10395 [Haloarcula sp. Atlit-7R]